MGRARNNALSGAAHLFEFRHEAGFRMQAARRVYDNIIRLARYRGLQRVEQHSSRIASGLSLDHFGAGALSPDFELLDGGGAEGIGRTQENVLALRSQDLRELADAGGLASAVDADDQDYFRRS